MKFRFSFGITLTCGQYEPALKLHPILNYAGAQNIAFRHPLPRSMV
ncbi:MAG: hypothetical protein Q7S46_05840 [Gallionella sp.]|nr:hypothetical protein [Gallionella sp.]